VLERSVLERSVLERSVLERSVLERSVRRPDCLPGARAQRAPAWLPPQHNVAHSCTVLPRSL